MNPSYPGGTDKRYCLFLSTSKLQFFLSPAPGSDVRECRQAAWSREDAQVSKQNVGRLVRMGWGCLPYKKTRLCIGALAGRVLILAFLRCISKPAVPVLFLLKTTFRDAAGFCKPTRRVGFYQRGCSKCGLAGRPLFSHTGLRRLGPQWFPPCEPALARGGGGGSVGGNPDPPLRALTANTQ